MNNPQKVSALIMEIDEKSRQIVNYLLREGHAEIRMLSTLIGASSDMDVLMRIKEIINPKAQELMGKPAITFERSKIDYLIGEKILFNWWINEEFVNSAPYEYSVEVMDEETLLRVIASLPPQEKNVDVTVADSILIISGEKYYQEVPLFCSVEKAAGKTLHNGVLEVKLTKVG